jgi:hypothetical protein
MGRFLAQVELTEAFPASAFFFFFLSMPLFEVLLIVVQLAVCSAEGWAQ